MTTTLQTEHECNAYCAGTRHAGVFWTNQADERIEATARDFLARHGLHLVRWQPAPEARWEGDPEFIFWDTTSRRHHIGRYDPRDRPVLLVWEEAARQLPLVAD